jgi:hypothetical protein
MLRIWVSSPSYQNLYNFCVKKRIHGGQAVNLVGPKGDFGLPPGKQDVRVMSLFFGNRSDPVHEIQGLLEVGEGEGASYVVFVDHFPVRPIRELLVNFG